MTIRHPTGPICREPVQFRRAAEVHAALSAEPRTDEATPPAPHRDRRPGERIA